MSIKVTLTANELFRFAMYHIYHARTGIFSLIAGAVAVILAVTRWGSSSTFEKVILCLCIFPSLYGSRLKICPLKGAGGFGCLQESDHLYLRRRRHRGGTGKKPPEGAVEKCCENRESRVSLYHLH